jgi:hypothetical protein
MQHKTNTKARRYGNVVKFTDDDLLILQNFCLKLGDTLKSKMLDFTNRKLKADKDKDDSSRTLFSISREYATTEFKNNLAAKGHAAFRKATKRLSSAVLNLGNRAATDIPGADDVGAHSPAIIPRTSDMLKVKSESQALASQDNKLSLWSGDNAADGRRDSTTGRDRNSMIMYVAPLHKILPLSHGRGEDNSSTCPLPPRAKLERAREQPTPSFALYLRAHVRASSGGRVRRVLRAGGVFPPRQSLCLPASADGSGRANNLFLLSFALPSRAHVRPAGGRGSGGLPPAAQICPIQPQTDVFAPAPSLPPPANVLSGAGTRPGTT